MKIVIPFFSSLFSMLVIDGVWLSLMAKRFYATELSTLMAKNPQFLPAGIFYLIYTLALTFLVVIPGVQSNFSISKIFIYGALFGLAAYATYDLTNQATLKDWSILVTIVDLVWGTILTGFVALIASIVTKHFA
jgi:uncharacterized membrane protein